jgi:MraZ protein
MAGLVSNAFNFMGAYTATLDAKHRLLLPSDHRRSLEQAGAGTDPLVLNLSAENRIWAFARSYYPQVVADIESRAADDAELEEIRYYMQGNAELVERDGQNRILVPARFREQAGIDREVVVVGIGDHLEIWRADEWKGRLGGIHSSGHPKKWGLSHRKS